MDNYLNIQTNAEMWKEEFNPGNRTTEEIIHLVQELVDAYKHKVIIDIFLSKEHIAVAE